MAITIRHYKSSDWKMVEKWWGLSGELAPEPEMMPTESSFIAEVDGCPALAVALYLTNTPSLAYAENFIGNPEVKGPKRSQAAHVLSDHIAAFAYSKGYRRILCMTEKPVLKSRYMELGFTPTLDGITTFVRRTQSCPQQQQ